MRNGVNNNTEYIKQLIDGKYSTVKQCNSAIIKTIANLSIKIYAKTAEWNNDLYAGCVTPTEQDTLLVESWIRGKAEGPVCPISDYNTLDIHYIYFVVGSGIDSRGIDSRGIDSRGIDSRGIDSRGIDSRWSETQDHSKWAITETKDVVCMGDINRMTSQYSRGGGTACFLDPVLHAVLKQAIIKTNTCV
jgi:deoxyribonuclease-2